MSNKRVRKKIQRAFPSYGPGGALMYVPGNYATSLQGQTFYGANTSVKTGDMPLFPAGNPLPPQPGINPKGLPVQFKFIPAYNTFAVDRTLGSPDIPSFQTLRQLSKMYSGIGLCERAWFDMVPRMRIKISLRPEFVAAGAEEQDYRKEITSFTNFFSKPDGQHDIHTWLRMALREQTQIDELYLYKDKKRGGQLLGLQVVDGSQMKPLLDDWGRLPAPPMFAYQQYPWGIPGMQYRTDQMIHYQESPAADTPYGFSRVERFILEVNQALRKKKKDLAYFTEGNIPQSFMEVPESLNWTPDQIDAYEQSWNSLLAGNAQQQVRIKFMQPGMKYTPADQYQMATDFDKYLLNIAAASYGLSMAELGFTENVNRASGESQEDMTYRRTIGPMAYMYGMILSDVMANDFPEEMHGDMLHLEFVGYDEADDLGELATAYSTLTGAGILGITNASKLLQLPDDPDAPHIGRVLITKDGPIFLDDMASDTVRKAALDAKMAGFEMAANPPEPQDSQTTSGNAPGAEKKAPQSENKSAKPGKSDDDEEPVSRVAEALARIDEQLRLLRAVNVTPGPQMVSQQGSCDCDICTGNHGSRVESAPPYHDGCDCSLVPKGTEHEPRAFKNTEDETRVSANPERTTRSIARAGAQQESIRDAAGGQDRAQSVNAEYRKWRDKAIKAVSSGKPSVTFVSDLIPREMFLHIQSELQRCTTADEVRAVFSRTREADGNPKEIAVVSGGNPLPIKRDWKLRW